MNQIVAGAAPTGSDPVLGLVGGIWRSFDAGDEALAADALRHNVFALVALKDETSPTLIDAGWRQIRQRLVGATRNAVRSHRLEYAARLAAATDQNVRRPVLSLLSELADRYGVAWSDIASMLRVSVPALRKWRKTGGGTSPETIASSLAWWGSSAWSVSGRTLLRAGCRCPW